MSSLLRAETESGQPTSMPRLDSVLFYGIFGLLLFGPLAFGAVQPWSIFVLEAGAAILFVIWIWREASSGEAQIIGNRLFLPMLVFAVLILVQILTHRTAYAYITNSTALLYCAYGILCFLVIQAFRRTGQVRQLLLLLSGYTFAVASFALVQGLSSRTQIYWIRTPSHGGWIYGPYVNHNHYAGLMEMLIPVPLVFALTLFAKGPPRTLAVVTAAVAASTIFLSGSRGGMISFVVETGVLAMVVLTGRMNRKTGLAFGGFLLIVVGMLVWIGGGELSKRLASLDPDKRKELAMDMRLSVDRDIIKMAPLKPVLGWGLGVFPEIYPKYRSFYTNLLVNEAHNDYLQLLIEMGLLGVAAMVWFLVVMYREAIKKIPGWTGDANGAIALAAMLGCTGILVHSLVDFNLQIPANAALFYVFCTIAAMRPRFKLVHRQRVRRHRAPAELREVLDPSIH